MNQKRKTGLQPLTTALTEMAGRVRHVIRQTKARVFQGLTQLPGKIVSLFEPHTEIIRKGKASKPTEFGKLVQIQEAENQIITHYKVFEARPSDRELLLTDSGGARANTWASTQAGGGRCGLLLAGTGTCSSRQRC